MSLPPDDESEWAVDPTVDDATLTGPFARDAGRTVLAEWALWGRGANEPDYRVLRCSKGAFHPGDFHEVIERYASGTQESLPQYTVCWIPDGDGHEGYVAVGIHELADPDPRRSGGRLRSVRGREIEYIRLFCVRYSEMATHGVRYAELAESVQGHQLPVGLTDPITVELLETESPPFPGPLRALAGNVATLLLTTRPVCVLGADDVAAEDRLRFIDQVMSLLPYGLRSTMSASTWASATAKSLKLRLFFTSAQRDDGVTTHLVWGQPVRFNLSELSADEGTPFRHYAAWLERAGAEAVAELAIQTERIRFDPGDIRRMVANLPRDRPVREVLEELADGVRHGEPEDVQAAVKRLRQRRDAKVSRGERAECRRAIKRLGLLKEHPGLHPRLAASVYRVLLRLAYGSRLSYASYCWIEECVGGPPGGALGREMLNLTFTSVLPWLLTSKSEGGYNDEELLDYLRQRDVEAITPMAEFCDHVDAALPAHRPAGYDFAVRYLRAYAEDPRAELARRGYLAQTLEAVFPHDQTAQRVRLKETLAFVYGGMLSKEASAELLSRPDVPHTPALEAAVAELNGSPGGDNSPDHGELRKHPQELGEQGRDAKVSASTATCLLVLGAVVIGVALALIAFLF